MDTETVSAPVKKTKGKKTSRETTLHTGLNPDLLHIAGKKAVASGYVVADGFVVCKGSDMCLTETKSCQK